MRFFKTNWKKTFYGVNGRYLTVYTLLDIKLRGHRVSLCLHNFHRGDEDPDCHDHPFSFFSFLLRGRYREHAEDQSFIDRRRWSLTYRSATHRHRVELLAPIVWTFCLKIDAKREWGFWRQGQFIPWRDYIKAKGLQPITHEEPGRFEGFTYRRPETWKDSTTNGLDATPVELVLISQKGWGPVSTEQVEAFTKNCSAFFCGHCSDDSLRVYHNVLGRHLHQSPAVTKANLQEQRAIGHIQ